MNSFFSILKQHLFFNTFLCILIILSSCKKEDYIEPTKSNTITNETARKPAPIFLTSKFSICNSGTYTNSPVGGGSGYTDIVSKSSCNVIITSALQFKTVLDSILPNNTTLTKIWIENDIDLFSVYSSFPIVLPSNIWLVGARGSLGSSGAKISYPYHTGSFAFYITKDNVRITGLRLEGPYGGSGGQSTTDRGIIIKNNSDHINIDNCELYNWTKAAIEVNQSNITNIANMSLDINIHHNYIHNNNTASFGYGVVIKRGWANISKNKFESNRHDIAGDGDLLSGYEAGCNIIMPNGGGTNFDMHGSNGDNGPEAGRLIHIHHNEFRDKGDFRVHTPEVKYNIIIRGKPTVQCRIENNIFYNSQVYGENSNSSFWTGSIANSNNNNTPNVYNRGNMIVINNIWGVNEYLGRYVVENWDQNRTTNDFNIISTGDLLTSENQYKFGDFDGNGKTDILKVEFNTWKTLPLAVGSLTDDWQQVNTSTADPTLLKVGCFNNDSKSDIFYANGSTWRYASGATGNWITYATSNASPIRLGRFHRNGYSDYIWDVFYSNSSTWSVSHDGSSWQQINTSSADKNFLRLGDFNGDGISDVFYAYGPSTNTWKVSYSGTNNFVTINNSGYSAYDVILADFDQDNSTAGITDVIANNGQYQISIGGTSSWTPLFTSNFPRSSFGYGNLK